MTKDQKLKIFNIQLQNFDFKEELKKFKNSKSFLFNQVESLTTQNEIQEKIILNFCENLLVTGDKDSIDIV